MIADGYFNLISEQRALLYYIPDEAPVTLANKWPCLHVVLGFMFGIAVSSGNISISHLDLYLSNIYLYISKSLMAQWLKRVPQGHQLWSP